MVEGFKIGKVLSDGWEHLKKNLGIAIGFTILAGVLLLIGPVLQFRGYALVGAIVAVVLAYICAIAWVEAGVLLGKGAKLTLTQIFSRSDRWFHFFVGTILFIFIVAVGLILFIIPGVIWFLRLQLFSYFVIDKNMNAFEALSASWKCTKGSLLNLFLVHIVLHIVNVIGALLVSVGLLVTIPYTASVIGGIYQKLQSKASSR